MGKKYMEFSSNGKKIVLSKKQMEKFYRKLNLEDAKEGQMLVIIGGDDGSIINYLAKVVEYRFVAVVEPLKSVSSKKRIRNYYSQLERISRGMIRYFYELEKDENSNSLFSFFMRWGQLLNASKVVVNPIYEEYFPKEALEALKKVKRYMIEALTSKGNSVQDEFYGIRNALYNLIKYKNSLRFVKNLNFDTVISVAAGPSLDDHMDELRELAKKYPVIAVDAVWRKLVDNGIIPDFVCSQERVLVVYEIAFKDRGEFPERSIYIPQIFTHPYAVNCAENVIFATRPAIPSNLYLHFHLYREALPVSTSTNVGLMNLTIAEKLSAKNILIFGQDLAYREDRTHAEGVDTSHVSKNKKEWIYVPGNRRKMVPTSKVFQRFILNFETYAMGMKPKGMKFYNFSDGAKINGFIDSDENMFREFLKKDVEKPDIFNLVEKVNFKDEHFFNWLKSERMILDNQRGIIQDLIDNPDSRESLEKFLKEFLENFTLLRTIMDIAITPFLAQMMSRRSRDFSGIKKNASAFMEMLNILEKMLDNTEKIIKGEGRIPPEDADIDELMDYMMYEIVQKIPFDDRGEIRKDATEYEIKNALIAFMRGFNPTNYTQFVKLAKEMEENYKTEENLPVIDSAMRMIFESIKLNWEVHKNTDPRLRYPLAAYAYRTGNYEYVIKFLEGFEDRAPWEDIILANAYLNLGKPEKSAEVFSRVIGKTRFDPANIVNFQKALIDSQKYVAGWIFHKKFGKLASHRKEYRNNLEILKDIVNNLPECLEINGKKHKIGLNEKCCSTDESVESGILEFEEEIPDLNEIVDILGRRYNLCFQKVGDKRYRYYILHDDSEIDFSELNLVTKFKISQSVSGNS